MCEDCGCGNSEQFTVYPIIPKHDHEHSHGDLLHSHSHDHAHAHGHQADHDHQHHHEDHAHDHDHQDDPGHNHDHHHGDHDHEHSHGDLVHSHAHDHEHAHGHQADHDHQHHHEDHAHEHSHGDLVHSHAHDHEHSQGYVHKKVIDLNLDVLSRNNLLAERNRGFFIGRQVLCLNLVSSPGSGKTTILEKTIQALIAHRRVFVIEGDQQTTLDAERIGRSGAPVVQLNTGTACHLDANMIQEALKKMEIGTGSTLFIENVGNLVCPALFDLGEKKRVVVISVTEGDDKPLKYPYMFQSSDLCIINKSDLLPYVDFDVQRAMDYARRLKPGMEFIVMSAKTGEGMEQWIQWLDQQR